MYIPFNQIENNARVWIYTASRPLGKPEVAHIEKLAPAFLEQWTAHGAGLQAAYTLKEGQFLVIAVNEAVAQASGCSIDSSVAFVRRLEEALDLSFTDRSLVPFWVNGKVELIKLPELKAKVAAGEISPASVLINTLAPTKAELEQSWHKPAGESWLKRYFKGVGVKGG